MDTVMMKDLEAVVATWTITCLIGENILIDPRRRRSTLTSQSQSLSCLAPKAVMAVPVVSVQVSKLVLSPAVTLSMTIIILNSVIHICSSSSSSSTTSSHQVHFPRR